LTGRQAAGWPEWEFWAVPRYIGGTVWCARRHDDHKKVLNAGSPQHLVDELRFALEYTREDTASP
jgi:hypothetical protein